MSLKLTKQEIIKRISDWRNMKNLYSRDRELITRLRNENKELKEQVRELKKQNEQQLLRIADLERKVFGSKRNHRNKNNDGKTDTQNSVANGKQGDKQPRESNTYRRSAPKEEEITSTITHPVTSCVHCSSELSQIEEVIRYVEDIILPQLLNQLTKTVTKQTIERGYCRKCGVWTSGKDLRGQLVQLGENVKKLTVYLITVLDCSYEQVKSLINDLYSLTLADGEIAAILKEKAKDWLPEYERLKTEIRTGEGAHLDETTWPIQTFAKHTYAWVMSAVRGTARVYKLSTSRGKDNASELLGRDFTGVRITDCFGAYKNQPGYHQICWAHLHRKIRDLVNNENLPSVKKPSVTEWYTFFCAVYENLRSVLTEPFDLKTGEQHELNLRERIENLRQSNQEDPKPLADLKNLLIRYDHALFTCLRFDNIPCDNNRAERDLRPLVIKRKKSFGCKTEQGARVMEIILSVVWSTWHARKENFFQAISKLG